MLERSGPFTARDAIEDGASYLWLRRWCASGFLRHPIRGVYHAAELADCLDLRLAVLRLVVPADCVVTDRTAGWLWGASMILAPGDHLVTPAVQVFCPPGHRLRNGLVASGERRLPPGDVVVLDGVRVTTQLRVLVPLVDPMAQSPGESVLRLRWIQAGIREHRWTILVLRKSNIYWRSQDADLILRRAWSNHTK